MKTVSKLLAVFFAVALTSTISMGMGYPQDMFAEHVTTKQVSNTAQPKKVKKEKMGGQKAASSRAAQSMNTKCKLPCKNQGLPKKKSNQPAASQPNHWAIMPACPKVCIVAVKVFNLDDNNVEEHVLPLDEFLEEEYMG